MPAKSKAQKRFMYSVKNCKEGGKCGSKEVSKAAGSMSSSDVKDFTKGKSKGLPEKVSEEQSFLEWLYYLND
jgi:hypothetical protein